MLIEFPNTALWKNLLALSEAQSEAIERAVQMAVENKEMACVIESDLHLLEVGEGKIGTPEEVRRKMYGDELYRMHPVLVLLMRLPWLIEQYSARGISEAVLKDTLSDVRIWMDVCQRKTGYPGLLEYGWLSNHFSFRLFRLGRLQFVYQKGTAPAYVYRHKESGTVVALCPNGSRYYPNGDGAGVNGKPTDDAWAATLIEENGRVEGFPIHRSGYAVQSRMSLNLTEWELAFKPGDPVLDMHIAEGCPLDPQAVHESLITAPEFFRKHLGLKDMKAFTCASWLLDDNIAQMMPGGNIAAFQRFFHLVPHDNSSDWQTRQRAFGNPDIDILTAECSTTLQKSIKAWYKAGRYCRHAAGFILL